MRIGPVAAILALLLAAWLGYLAGNDRFGTHGSTGMTSHPCPEEQTARRDAIALRSGGFLAAPLGEQHRDLMRDWAELCYYRPANDLIARSGKRPVAVFLGDSITEGWGVTDPALFTGRFANRGIRGQTSGQMLLRFRSDVAALKPRAVHIMAGLNDIAGNTGPSRIDDFKDNITAIADIAQANGIAVILASVTPARTLPWANDRPVAMEIAQLNRWLQSFAAARGLAYADYHAALVASDGGLQPRFDSDGAHLRLEGYTAMRSIAERAIGAATGQSGEKPTSVASAPAGGDS